MLRAMGNRTEVTAVTTSIRSTTLALLLAVVALAGAACTPAAGPLGTPATPAATADASSEPLPSDVAPSDAAPSAPSPTPAPSATPGEASAGPSTTPPSTTPSAAPATAPTPAGTTTVRAYFMLGSFTDNPGLAPVLRTIPETKAVATAAMHALLAGPKGAELAASPALYTAIPAGTRLLGVTIADGVATVDLSPEFASGGGTYSMAARLAQVVYTLTQFPTVDSVLFQLDGVPVTTFSSEGIVLAGPQTRADYRELLPAIFVDRPAWGAAAGNPVKLSGLANVFEATFRVQVLDTKGTVLADQQVTASCGTGCWGSFRASVPYEIGKAQYGTLRVFEPSARDGSPVNVTEYRAWLTP
jgi:Sporulation and spore germination/Immunoglobulin-like domain of bacterial spore germination